MKDSYVVTRSLPEYELWEKMDKAGALAAFEYEMTERCNFDCRHCYINRPAGDKRAKKMELSLDEISRIADEAVSLGALWCLLTGGEPLLRKDFNDVFMLLKRKGLLVSVFTNASLITPDHIKLFKDFPPRDIEVSVYGVTRETFERVTRKKGSFAAFEKGLDMLLEAGIKVRLKAMVLRSNLGEWEPMARFCRSKTKDYFRYDPFLHLRYDRDSLRNTWIKEERLSASEIVEVEKADPERFQALKKECALASEMEESPSTDGKLFRCGVGGGSFVLGYDGQFRLCSALMHPDCVSDLRKESLLEAWKRVVHLVRAMSSRRKAFLDRCSGCSLLNVCLWCPAIAYLETGQMDFPVDYFCEVAHARVDASRKPKKSA